MKDRVYQLDPIAPLITSDGIAHPSGMLRFEYFEAGPNAVSAPPSTAHNLAVNFTETPIEIEHQRDGMTHTLALSPGAIVATPAGIATGWRWRQPIKVGLIWIDAALMQQFLETHVGVFVNTGTLRHDIVLEHEGIFGIAMRLRQVLESREIGANVLVDALSRALVVLMLRHHQADTYELRPANSDLSPDRFRDVVEMVQSHLTERLSLDDLSRAAGMSRSHFAQSFKSLTTKTPMQFVMEQRLQSAQRMLLRSSLTIGQIALKSGFADQAHLTRKFKAAFGQTPGQFRKALHRQTSPNVRQLRKPSLPHIQGEAG